ncbi:MAG: phosphatidylglycerophosphatase A [Pseudomonadota bacterium]
MLKNKSYSVIATGFGVGKIPFAPGTFGSLLAVLIWVAVNKFLPFELPLVIFWISLLIILSILGIFSAEFHSKKIGKNDAGEIVIDEICGQLLTFLIAAIFIDTAHDYLLIFLGFVFFRLLDITKPFIIGIADQNVKGGLGVMLDDLLAGFAAAVLLYVVDAFLLK